MTRPIPVVIDTDIGSDPDDALALALALASPEIDVRGVTIVSGDVTLRGRMAARLLGMAGRPAIPVFLGQGVSLGPDHAPVMDGSEGLGLLDVAYEGPVARIQTEHAVDWMLAESHRAPFHLIAIGSLTNVALALERDPGFRQRLLGLTVMGGLLDASTMPEAWRRNIAKRGAAAWPDYNTTSDPMAALQVARAGSPITWAPLDATMRASLRQGQRDHFSPEHPLGVALGQMIDAWHAAWFPSELPASTDPAPVARDAVAILHDPLAVATLFPGDWLRLRPERLTPGIEDGIFRLRQDPLGIRGVVTELTDGAAFSAFCLARVSRLLDGISRS